MEGVKCVLLDIEGTIVEISFVKDVLFPYALKALPDVLATKWEDEDFAPYKSAFPEDGQESPEKLQAHVEDLTQRDVKIAYLKNLQGYLWETGYKTGAYFTPLFPDVAAKLREWRGAGVDLAIYSSGSVFAQKLLFGHVKTANSIAGQKRIRAEDEDDGQVSSGEPPAKKVAKSEPNGEVKAVEGVTATKQSEDADSKASASEAPADDEGAKVSETTTTEDLQPLIRDWFDTTNAGPKTESASYGKIAEALEMDPGDVLFLSDNVKEVDAALAAGMQSLVVDRPGNAPLSQTDKDRLTVVTSLDQVEVAVAKPDGTAESEQRVEGEQQAEE